MPIPFKTHAERVFLDPNHFAEKIVYIPKTGLTRTVKAVVARQQFESVPGGFQSNSPVFLVSVKNDGVDGVFGPDVDQMNDKVELLEREDQRERGVFVVARIVDQDRGMLTLEVR